MSLARRALGRQRLISQHASYQTAGRPRSTIFRQIKSQSTFTAEPPKPQRSLLNSTFRSAVGASVFLIMGVYIGYELFPGKPSLMALLRKPPTDAETNDLYEPPDAATAQINAHVLAHGLARRLRADPAFVESRPHMKIPEALRRGNLTGGTLAGPGRIAVPPVQFVERDGRSLVSIVYLGEQLCGHPGIVHGGLLATLLDEGLARCCFPALPNGIGVTANLKIDYRRPVKAQGYYVLRATTEKVEGRKAWVKGWIEKLGDDAQEVGDNGEAKSAEKLVEAEALFIEPRNAEIMKRIYTP